MNVFVIDFAWQKKLKHTQRQVPPNFYYRNKNKKKGKNITFFYLITSNQNNYRMLIGTHANRYTPKRNYLINAFFIPLCEVRRGVSENRLDCFLSWQNSQSSECSSTFVGVFQFKLSFNNFRPQKCYHKTMVILQIVF